MVTWERKLHGPLELLRQRECNLTRFPQSVVLRMNPSEILDYIRYLRSFDPTKPIERLTRNDPLKIARRIAKYHSRGFKVNTSQLEITREAMEKYLTHFNESSIHTSVQDSSLPAKSIDQIPSRYPLWQKIIFYMLVAIHVFFIYMIIFDNASFLSRMKMLT